jgi:uncharacterized protein (DUF58 family)
MGVKMTTTAEIPGERPVGPEGRSFTAAPAGCLLGKFGLLAILAGLLLAAWFDQVVIVIVLGLALSAAGLSWLWSRLSLARVTCERRLGEHRAFPGENISLAQRLVNRKLLPLPWVQMEFEIPAGLSPLAKTSTGFNGAPVMSKAAALLWYTGVTWNDHVYCKKRGYYRFGPVTLSSGDIFGFYPRSVIGAEADHLIVYPQIYPVGRPGIPSLHPIGDTPAERRIFEDPVRVIGVRDYDPRDSLRHVHWKASARRQALQVKVFEPTTTLKAAIFLAIDTYLHNGPEDEVEMELGISAAASFASYLIENRSAAGLFVNSRLADSGLPAGLLPGSRAGQLVEILEALAKVTPAASAPFEDFLAAERHRLPWGTTLLFILSRASPLFKQTISGLKESGHRLAVFQTGAAADGDTPEAVPWHYIRQPGDLADIRGSE